MAYKVSFPPSLHDSAQSSNDRKHIGVYLIPQKPVTPVTVVTDADQLEGRWNGSGQWVTRFAERYGEQLAQTLKPGDLVEWLSPALPRQQGEVLAVHSDHTFTVFHPLSEALCRLPVAWITRIVTTEMEGL